MKFAKFKFLFSIVLDKCSISIPVWLLLIQFLVCETIFWCWKCFARSISNQQQIKIIPKRQNKKTKKKRTINLRIRRSNETRSASRNSQNELNWICFFYIWYVQYAYVCIQCLMVFSWRHYGWLIHRNSNTSIPTLIYDMFMFTLWTTHITSVHFGIYFMDFSNIISGKLFAQDFLANGFAQIWQIFVWLFVTEPNENFLEFNAQNLMENWMKWIMMWCLLIDTVGIR